MCVSVLFRKTMYECICVLSGKTVRPYWLPLGKCVPASLGGAGGVGAERMKKLGNNKVPYSLDGVHMGGLFKISRGCWSWW